MKHDELITAWKQGAKIQKFVPCNTDENLEGGHWLDNPKPSWDEDAHYRIKPEK